MGYKKVYWEFGQSAKSSSVQVHTAVLNVGNIAAQETARAAFETAVDAMVLGETGSEVITASETNVARNPSSNPLAQRENKWLVSFIDNGTGFGGSFTIPTADLSLLTGGDGQFIPTTAAEYIALKSAVEDYVLSKGGNTVTMTSVKFSGRTLG